MTTHGIWRIYAKDCVDSTNDEAARLVAGGNTGSAPIAVIAAQQTAGKGRTGRSWHSPAEGGLWFSLVVTPDKEPAHLSQITLLAAVAVAEAVEEVTGVAPGIKWPNDLLHEGKKLCGILTQTAPVDAQDEALPVIVGIGLNVAGKAEDFPPDLKDCATSLSAITGVAQDGQKIFLKILDKFHAWYELWLAEGFAPVRQKWIDASCTMNRTLSWEEGGARRIGKAVDLETDGSLRVCMDDGAIHRLNAGEIRFLRAAQ